MWSVLSHQSPLSQLGPEGLGGWFCLNKSHVAQASVCGLLLWAPTGLDTVVTGRHTVTPFSRGAALLTDTSISMEASQSPQNPSTPCL